MKREDLDKRALANFRSGLSRDCEFIDLEHKLDEIRVGAGPLARVAAEAALSHLARHWYDNRVAAFAFGCSPIETLLGLALVTYAESLCDEPVEIRPQWRPCDGKHVDQPRGGPRRIFLCHQHRIGEYHADFFLSGYDIVDFEDRVDVGRIAQVVVEADGHDFHERTQSQASHDRRRDRAMQSLGYLVFRYPGTDIFRDPFACAKEAIDAALGLRART